MKRLFIAILVLPMFVACGGGAEQGDKPTADTVAVDTFQYQTEQFADVRVLRYQVDAWNKLTLQQKKLAYYLSMAGLAGRDIMWDQNYRHNLKIRRALETIIKSDKVQRSGADWDHFMVYAKEVFFSNGIHHHYGSDKFTPEFPRAYFEQLLGASGANLSKEVVDVIFDPAIDAMKVEQAEGKDAVLASAVNFYGDDINTQEVKAFYKNLEMPEDTTPLSYGINSKLVRNEKGQLEERVWKVGGMYSKAIEQMVMWLEKAKGVAESPAQAEVNGLLIKFYNTGDLQTWDDFNVAWTRDKGHTVDFIQGFVEVYNDPLGKRGSFESCVEIIDAEASQHMKVIQDNAQWFEDNSPLLPQHKKKDVVGIWYGFVSVVNEAGDAAPSTPIGVNLPNADWIRKSEGSKSVSLGNITRAYEKSAGTGSLEEFCNDTVELALAKEYGALAGNLHTALHEVIGHASGQLEPGVGQPDATLETYASTMEEGRADLVALYYMMDPKLVEWKVMPSLEVGKAEYDAYIRNGLIVQLRRIKPGKSIQEAHMRNRHWISAWVFEKGQADSVIVKVERNGNTYYDIRDYEKLRGLFGELLRETQRIKSQGDLAAAKALVEGYGVQVDPELHRQVLARAEKLKTAPYQGFIQPELVPVLDEKTGEITDIKLEFPMDFLKQMLMYGEKHSFLPDEN